jgi:hypothetical protein
MMPYETYRLYHVERGRNAAEVRRADEQAARLASAVSSRFRVLTRPRRAMPRLGLARTRGLPRSM